MLVIRQNSFFVSINCTGVQEWKSEVCSTAQSKACTGDEDCVLSTNLTFGVIAIASSKKFALCSSIFLCIMFTSKSWRADVGILSHELADVLSSSNL